ncbi:MAG: type IV pilus modification PilV family protein [Bacillota bacterium]
MASGFTLIEVLIALVLIATVLTGIMNLLLASSKQLLFSNQQLTAYNLARWKLEEYLEQDHNNLLSTPCTSFKIAEYSNYQYQLIVKPLNNYLKEVTIIVKDCQKVRAKLSTIAAKGV